MENQPMVTQVAPKPKKSPMLFIVIGVVVLLIVGGVLAFKSLTQKAPPPTEEGGEEVQLPPADPNITVFLEASSDKKSVNLVVGKIPSGTQSVEYELSYTTGEGLPKGALGKISLNGKTEVERNILLGTCSTGGKCSYDTGVTKVKLVLRFNQTSGATQFTKEYPLQ